MHHARGSRKSTFSHTVYSHVFLRILGICHCISVGRWVCVKVFITQDISWRSLTGSSSDIIPGELAVVLHPAISEAENISLTNYVCIMNIIVSVEQMLSLLETWFRFMFVSRRMHISGIQKKRSSINSIFNLEYLSYKLTAKGKNKTTSEETTKQTGWVGSQSTTQ